MAEKIVNFFKKKKLESRFKKAGPGHKLTDDTSSKSLPHQDASPLFRGPPSSESQQAAAAALARLNVGKSSHQAAFNTSLATIQSQVRRELEAEKKASSGASTNLPIKDPKVIDLEASPLLAVQGVYFRCPLISDEVLSRDEWHAKIREFLYETLEAEPGLTACLIIHSCNKGREKVSNCVDTLKKYLENIINNPEEEKYRRIRLSNRIFQEKVAPMEGTIEFLQAAGFEKQKLPVNDTEEDFLVFSSDSGEALENLQMLQDALQNAEPLQLELDRNVRVLYPSQAAKQVELPPVFFSITPEELKREQQLRTEGIERNLMLRTKAMREKEELREMRKYRFALIRVRFPNGILLQGTFSVHEKYECVTEFVRDNLEDENLNFFLSSPTGQRLTEDDKPSSLVDLRLVPATILTFAVESDAPPDREKMYLKPEVMLLVQPVD